MKKFFIISIFAIGFSAYAQSLVPQSIASNTAPAKVQPAQTKAEAERQGYSIAFLAYHFNNLCSLGLDRNILENLSTELSRAEKINDIKQEDIDRAVGEARRVHDEDPIKFCADATKVATTLKALFAPK